MLGLMGRRGMCVLLVDEDNNSQTCHRRCGDNWTRHRRQGENRDACGLSCDASNGVSSTTATSIAPP